MRFSRPFSLEVGFFALCLSSFSLFGELEKKEALTVEMAKFELTKLYLAEDSPPKKLRAKYPELKAADEAANEVLRELGRLMVEHPAMKPRYAEIDALDVSKLEKLKLKRPLLEEAKSLPEIVEGQKKLDVLRLKALRAEVKALKAEGYQELAAKMEAVLQRVPKPQDEQ